MSLTRHQMEQHAVQLRIAAALERIADTLDPRFEHAQYSSDELVETLCDCDSCRALRREQR